MVVTAWHNGKGTYGIRVGVGNRAAYFKSHWTEIEVEIEGFWKLFQLSSGFWRQCPEFRDREQPIIREWLLKHHSLEWPQRHPPQAWLEPMGGRRFRLSPSGPKGFD